MSRVNYESVVEMLSVAISDKSRSINLEVDLISKCGYSEEILDRAKYLATVVAGRDALVTFLYDIKAREEE